MIRGLRAVGRKKCLICLKHASALVPLSTEVDIDGIAMNCETMYGKFIGIQYDIATLSKKRLLNLCLTCLMQLNSSYLFQRQAIESVESIFASFFKSQEQSAIVADALTIQYLISPDEQSICHSETGNYLEEESRFEMTNRDPNSTLVYPPDKEVQLPDEVETDTEKTEEFTADEELVSIDPDSTEDNAQNIEQMVPKVTQPSYDKCVHLKSDLQLFRKHVQQTHCLKKDDDFFHCTVCSGHFKPMRSCIRHARTHQGTKRYACQFCHKSFYYSHHLQAHERIHTPDKPFVCSQCAKEFVSKGRLSAHEETHSKRGFECKECRGKFKTRQNLYKHYLIKHDRPVAKFPPRKCEHCDKLMLSQSAVTYHKLHSCVMNRQYRPQTVQGDSRHLKIPTNRKYVCVVCRTQFIQKIELDRHKLIHDGILPYRCDVCDRTFRQKGTLTTHMRTHTDEKPYECTQCTIRFRSAASRRSHFLRHHLNIDKDR
ncbi:zinc finger protein 184-like [Anopheles marshallii]|uniref:zinc finger protein 184-like n=1 Tax=Anopheles marshallii TaxID=1521116 RepID=UPI00237AFFC9|nr:zinc finger protein 184-like [Anopheles marshallii]